MPVNKNAAYRYRLIDHCLSNKYKKWTYEELLNFVSEKVQDEFDVGKGISKRTFDYDLNIMRKDPPEGYGAPIVRKDGEIFYEDPDFSISRQPFREEEKEQIKAVIEILDRFRGADQLDWLADVRDKLGLGIESEQQHIVEFDHNPFLKGREFLQPLFNYIKNKQVVETKYRSFKEADEQVFSFHPYFIKEYNNRWFVFGYRPDIGKLANLAFDRIHDIKPVSEPYVENATFDFLEYFEDIVGVTILEGIECEEVKIKLSKAIFPYIVTKPLHGSQKIVERGDDFKIIALDVRPNIELENLILHHGEHAEVLNPEWFREKIAERVTRMKTNYGIL